MDRGDLQQCPNKNATDINVGLPILLNPEKPAAENFKNDDRSSAWVGDWRGRNIQIAERLRDTGGQQRSDPEKTDNVSILHGI